VDSYGFQCNVVTDDLEDGGRFQHDSLVPVAVAVYSSTSHSVVRYDCVVRVSEPDGIGEIGLDRVIGDGDICGAFEKDYPFDVGC